MKNFNRNRTFISIHFYTNNKLSMPFKHSVFSGDAVIFMGVKNGIV